MNSFSTFIAAVNLLGAFNGLLLGIVLISSGRRGTGAWWLGALVLTASLVLALITLEHQHWITRHWTVYALEEFLSLLSAPMLLAYMLRTFEIRAPIWIFAPPAIYLLTLALPMLGFPRFYGMHHVMWIQIAYSIAAAVVFFNQRQSLNRRFRATERITGWVLGTVFAIHLAQIIRRLFSDIEVVRSIVPAVGTVCFYMLLVYALRQSGLTRQLARPRGPSSSDTASQFAAIESVMGEQRPWLEPALDLETLASLTQLPPQAVTDAINANAGAGFYEYLAGWRLAEAKRLLTDPDEARYTIEGIARQCGFGSRSSFYKTFRDNTGLTPAEYRRQHLAISDN